MIYRSGDAGFKKTEKIVQTKVNELPFVVPLDLYDGYYLDNTIMFKMENWCLEHCGPTFCQWYTPYRINYLISDDTLQAMVWYLDKNIMRFKYETDESLFRLAFAEYIK